MKLKLTPLLTFRRPNLRAVHITMVGCGGTGSHIASGLASLRLEQETTCIPATLLFIDPDKVEPKNVGRQLFTPSEIGSPKAHRLAERLNIAYGLTIGHSERWIDALDTFISPNPDALNIVIGAVDNPAARAIIAKAVRRADGRLWWLDCGNENHSGQIALGNCGMVSKLLGAVALGFIDRLPAPDLIYPDLIKTPKARSSRRAQSCAELTATGEQSLMVNRMVAAWALSLLHDFLLGELRYFAIAFDLAQGGTRPYALDLPTLSEVTGIDAASLQSNGKRS